MKKSIPIRLAQKKDFKNFVYLNSLVQKLHSTALGNRFKNPVDVDFSKEDFEKILDNDSESIFFAMSDELPVGYIFWEIKTKIDNYSKLRKVLYVNHISIDLNYKNKGVGSVLIEHAKSEAKKLKLDAVELDVWSFNKEAYSFFAKKGFKPFNIKMEFDIK